MLFVCRDGFEPERIEAVLHKIELGLKHQSEKFGLNLGVVSICIIGFHSLYILNARCRLRGCKNRPAPFPGQMLYKANK